MVWISSWIWEVSSSRFIMRLTRPRVLNVAYEDGILSLGEGGEPGRSGQPYKVRSAGYHTQHIEWEAYLREQDKGMRLAREVTS